MELFTRLLPLISMGRMVHHYKINARAQRFEFGATKECWISVSLHQPITVSNTLNFEKSCVLTELVNDIFLSTGFSTAIVPGILGFCQNRMLLHIQPENDKDEPVVRTMVIDNIFLTNYFRNIKLEYDLYPM